MDEIIICPVCKKKIPANFLNCCFYCGFDLKNKNDEKCIEFAVERFFGYEICVEKGHHTSLSMIASVVLGFLLICMSLHACSVMA